MDRSHRWWSTQILSLARSEYSNNLELGRSEGGGFDLLRHFQQVRTRELAPLETGRWELVI